MRVGVLPLYSYNAAMSCAVEANSATLALFAALVLLLGWCAFAAYTELQALATLLSYLAAWFCYVVCLHASHRAGRADLRRLCEDLTPEMVGEDRLNPPHCIEPLVPHCRHANHACGECSQVAQGVITVAGQQVAALRERRRIDEKDMKSRVARLSSYQKQHRAAHKAMSDAYYDACEEVIKSLQTYCCDAFFTSNRSAKLTEFGFPAQQHLERVRALQLHATRRTRIAIPPTSPTNAAPRCHPRPQRCASSHV